MPEEAYNLVPSVEFDTEAYNFIPSIKFDIEVQSLRTPSYSPITDCGEHDNYTRTKEDAESINTVSSSVRDAAAIKGYPGQFEGLKPQVKNDTCKYTPPYFLSSGLTPPQASRHPS